MLQALRLGLPTHQITALLAPRVAPLAQATDLIDSVLLAEPGMFATLANLRHERFDLAVFPYAKSSLAIAAILAGIPRRIGNGLRLYSPLFSDRVKVHRSHPPLHEADYCLKLLEPLGLPASSTPQERLLPRLTPPRPEAAFPHLDALGVDPKNFVIVHPGGGGSAGRADPETFGRFGKAAQEAACPGARLVMTAGPGEEEQAQRAAEVAGGVCLPPIPDILDFLAVLSHSSLFLAGSTGPLHMAAASGVPTLGFYPWKASQTAARWEPRGLKTATLSPSKEPCEACQSGICTKPACFARISPEQVAEAAKVLVLGNL